MRHLLIFMFLLTATFHIDFYQDRKDNKRTVIVIEKNGVVETLTVNNSDLNDKLIDELVEKYGEK